MAGEAAAGLKFGRVGCGPKTVRFFAIRAYLGVALGGRWLGDAVSIETAPLELWA